jgi:hypothetical protein
VPSRGFPALKKFSQQHFHRDAEVGRAVPCAPLHSREPARTGATRPTCRTGAHPFDFASGQASDALYLLVLQGAPRWNGRRGDSSTRWQKNGLRRLVCFCAYHSPYYYKDELAKADASHFEAGLTTRCFNQLSVVRGSVVRSSLGLGAGVSRCFPG